MERAFEFSRSPFSGPPFIDRDVPPAGLEFSGEPLWVSSNGERQQLSRNNTLPMSQDGRAHPRPSGKHVADIIVLSTTLPRRSTGVGVAKKPHQCG